MPEYRLRIDAEPEKHLALAEWVKSFASEFLLVRHTDKNQRNEHVHGWIKTHLALPSVRLRIKNTYPQYYGNKGYSLTPCDEERRDEYRTYMFNLKKGNIPFFIAQVGVPQWVELRDAAKALTDEYHEKTKNSYTKNDCLTEVLQYYATRNEVWCAMGCYAHVLEMSRKHNVLFSINAVRDIIMYSSHFAVGDPDGPTRTPATTLRDAVLKIFYQ